MSRYKKYLLLFYFFLLCSQLELLIVIFFFFSVVILRFTRSILTTDCLNDNKKNYIELFFSLFQSVDEDTSRVDVFIKVFFF